MLFLKLNESFKSYSFINFYFDCIMVRLHILIIVGPLHLKATDQ
jgi:hypothetical protein